MRFFLYKVTVISNTYSVFQKEPSVDRANQAEAYLEEMKLRNESRPS